MTKTLSHTLSKTSPARRSSERRRVLDLLRSLNHQLSTINYLRRSPAPAPSLRARRFRHQSINPSIHESTTRPRRLCLFNIKPKILHKPPCPNTFLSFTPTP